ncbi:copia protein [Tanacetum coccineum]
MEIRVDKEGTIILEDELENLRGQEKNKKDEDEVVVRNKNARLVAQGNRQERRDNSDEVFAPVARIEAIRIIFAICLFTWAS